MTQSDPPLPLHWRVAPPDANAAAALAAAVGVSPVIAQLLLNRGVGDSDEALRFLDPRLSDLHEPGLLPDIEPAVERLQRALEKNERIFVHGDYDVDGVTSAALCLRALVGLGADVIGFVPSRMDGYDLQKRGVDRAREAGATLILTADCGSCAIEPIAYAGEQGIDVIVTDHHRPSLTLPAAVAVVNPYRLDASPDLRFRELCGAAVAFKLMDALVERVMPQHRTAFRGNFLDLVALGTVADVTPLCSENRVLVAHGLRSLSATKKTGIRALLLDMNLQGKAIDSQHISWHIGPRLNAAGRMEDADLAYRLLITRDAGEAAELAAKLSELAQRTREEIARVTTEAVAESLAPEHAGKRVLVIARENWASGVIGVAAGRLAEQTRRPTILLAMDAKRGICHGSARTYGAFNFHEALGGCVDLLERFGGHSAAAGVSLATDNLEAFRERLHEMADGLVSDEPVAPVLEIDAELPDGGALTFGLVEQMQRLAPFGSGNPEPMLATMGATVLSARRAGKDNNTCLLNVRLPGSGAAFKGVWFRNGAVADRLTMGDEVDLAYTPTINEWQGKSNVELSIRDLRAAANTASIK